MDLGSTLRTDGWRGQLDVAMFGYTPRIRVILTPERAHRLAPHINRVFRNLETWFNGMHDGVEFKYLQSYLDFASTDGKRRRRHSKPRSGPRSRKPC
jgi:hypothetical protein